MTTVKAALANAAGRLAAAGADDAAREAGWLLAHVLKTSAGALRLQGQLALTAEQAAAFAALTERRLRREPIQYVLGPRNSWGYRFWSPLPC